MVSVATVEPTSFHKGDKITWRKELSDYPASSWVLTYYIRGTASLNVVCTADGDSHVALISTTNSETLTAGEYWWQAIATKTGERVTVANGKFDVLASLADASAGHDGRSHVKKVLDALEALLEGKASADQMSYSIQGRSLTKMSPDELLTWHAKYQVRYKREVQELARQNGMQTKSNKIQVRFNS